MKKLLALMLAAALALSLVACSGGSGAGDNNTPSTGNGDTTSNIEPKENSNDNESTIIEFDSPITILDSNNVTITATAKVEEDKWPFGHIVGYRTTIENKNDKYLSVMIEACSIDGTMLNDNELVNFDPNVIAPNTRADATMMIQLNSPCDHISSIDDLHDLSGTWDIYVSDDNTSWGGNGNDERISDKILNILP